MLEKWGIYSFFSVTWIQGQCTISLFVSIPMTTYFGVLYSPKPHLTLLKLADLALCCCAMSAGTHKTQHPQTTLPLWGKSHGHQEICQLKPASILPQINFFMLYLYKSPAQDSLPCPPSTPPAVLTPQVPLPQAQPLSLLHFPLSPALNPCFLPLTQWLGAGGKAGDSINICVRKSALGNVSWRSCHTQKKLLKNIQSQNRCTNPQRSIFPLHGHQSKESE